MFELRDNNSTLVLEFREKEDIMNCIILLKNILEFSSSYRETILLDEKVSKKYYVINKLKRSFNKLVKREDISEKLMADFICAIRKGSIENIIAHFKGRKINFTTSTDFEQIILSNLLNKTQQNKSIE